MTDVVGTDTFFTGFLDDYFAECDEHFAGAARALLTLEQVMGQPAAERAVIDELFRHFHSLKGISAMVGLHEAEQLAHQLEHYLRAIRERETSVSTVGIEGLIEGTQRLEQIVHAHRSHSPLPPIDDILAMVTALLPGRDASVGGSGPAAHPGAASAEDPNVSPRRPAQRQWIGVFVPTRELLAAGIGVDAIRKRLTELGRIVDATPEVRSDGSIAFRFTLTANTDIDIAEALRADAIEVTEVAPAKDSGVVPASLDAVATMPAASHVVRVDLAKLDELMRHVGDLVISRARLTDIMSRLECYVPAVEWRPVQENVLALDRQLRTLREGIMRVRLVPIGEIFRRMPFVVRDLARETGKKVMLDLRGQSTEIDKYLIERMMDPVLHLVRNAICHGIETSDDRLAAGKPPEGVITLAASAAGEVVTLNIADDGCGIDVEAVAARARAAGLAVAPGPLDAAGLLALLCTSGFSTRDETDRASGRGVGMAVVKATVEQLSGSMTLSTTPGAGTSFTIQLPLTLAIADALIGRVGGESFAIPQSAVREVIEVLAGDVRMLEQNEIVPYRDGALPIVRLSRLFGTSDSGAARFHVFVVGIGAAAVGIAVDRIVGQREIVVRAITDPLARVEGIAGATDLGDGRVVLILDPAAVSRLARRRAAPAQAHRSQWGRLHA